MKILQRLIILGALFAALLVPSSAQTWGVLTMSGVATAGQILVGDNTTRTDQTAQSCSGNHAVGRSFVAAGSGNAVTGYCRMRGLNGTVNVKMIIASSNGTLLETSTATTVTTTYTTVAFTFAGTTGITASTTYKIGVIADDYIDVAYTGTYEAINSTNSYTTPTTFTGNNGEWEGGLMQIWIIN